MHGLGLRVEGLGFRSGARDETKDIDARIRVEGLDQAHKGLRVEIEGGCERIKWLRVEREGGRGAPFLTSP